MRYEITYSNSRFEKELGKKPVLFAYPYGEYNLEAKKEKLAQYAERVWGVTFGSIEEKAIRGIEKTEYFLDTGWIGWVFGWAMGKDLGLESHQ